MEKNIPNYYLYGETEAVDELRFVHIESIESRSSLHDWKIQAHRHDHLFQILFLEKGDVHACIDEADGCCRDTSVITVPPAAVHSFDFSHDSQGTIITIEESFLLSVFDLKERYLVQGLLGEVVLTSTEADSSIWTELTMLVEQLRREFKWPGLGSVSLIGAYLKTLMIMLARMRHKSDELNILRSRNRAAFDRFRFLLEQHLVEHWSVQRYADKLGVTVGKLNRICTDFSQRPPSDIIQRRLMVEARRLLAYTGMSINEVCYHLGFKDPAYFSRYFCRNQGVSPSHFKTEVEKR